MNKPLNLTIYHGTRVVYHEVIPPRPRPPSNLRRFLVGLLTAWGAK